MVAHFVAVGTGTDGSERLVANADAVLATLRHAADAEQWDQIIDLARVAAPAFMLGARWGAWETVLDTTLRAGRALGDDEAEEWARRQLAVRAAALADQPT